MKQTHLIPIIKEMSISQFDELHKYIAELEAEGFELRSSQKAYLTFSRDVVRMDDQSKRIYELNVQVRELQSALEHVYTKEQIISAMAREKWASISIADVLGITILEVRKYRND